VLFAFFAFSCAGDEAFALTDGDAETRADEAGAALEMGGHLSGQVIRADPMSMTLVLRSPASDEGVVTITARSGTTYSGTESLKTIKPGDYVSVDTISFHDNYYADNVVMQKKYEEDDTPSPLERVLSD
jgi:hypothetical protein